jgi:hypothetical protein
MNVYSFADSLAESNQPTDVNDMGDQYMLTSQSIDQESITTLDQFKQAMHILLPQDILKLLITPLSSFTQKPAEGTRTLLSLRSLRPQERQFG